MKLSISLIAAAMAATLGMYGETAWAREYRALRIEGDRQAAPIQALSDGETLFLQLRNPADPPAPINADGKPMTYRIRPPYMEVAPVSMLTLVYGDYRAVVRDERASTVMSRMAMPIDPLEEAAQALRLAQAAARKAARATTPTVGFTDEQPAAPAETVTGRISVIGDRPVAERVQQTAASPQPQSSAAIASAMAGSNEVNNKARTTPGKSKPTPAIAAAKPAAPKPAVPAPVLVKPKPAAKPSQPSLWLVSYNEAADLATYADKAKRGQRMLLVADGTASGAEAVLAARDACAKAQGICSVQYDGGVNGSIQIREMMQ